MWLDELIALYRHANHAWGHWEVPWPGESMLEGPILDRIGNAAQELKAAFTALPDELRAQIPDDIRHELELE